MSKRQYIMPNGSLVEAPAPRSKTFAFLEQRILGLDLEARTIEAVVSTAALDSYRESVLPGAFTKRLPSRFNKNAPLIAGHVYHAEDGTPGKIGEWIEMGVREVPGLGMALVGKAKIFKGYPLADTCWQIMTQSQSLAFSVGWLTHAWEMQERTEDDKTFKVRVYTDVELVEVSFVTVPANPEAVVQASIEAQRDSERQSSSADAIAKALANIDARLTGMAKLIDTITSDLDVEPGSKLHELVMSTCRQMQGCGLHDGDGLDGAQDESGDAGGHPAMKYLGL